MRKAFNAKVDLLEEKSFEILLKVYSFGTLRKKSESVNDLRRYKIRLAEQCGRVRASNSEAVY